MFLLLGRLAQHNCFLHFLRITHDKSSKFWIIIIIPPFAGHFFLFIRAQESRPTASTSPVSAHHVVLAAVIVTGLDKVIFSIAHTDYHQEENHFLWVLNPWVTSDQMKMNLVQISLHMIYCTNRETRQSFVHLHSPTFFNEKVPSCTHLQVTRECFLLNLFYLSLCFNEESTNI